MDRVIDVAMARGLHAGARLTAALRRAFQLAKVAVKRLFARARGAERRGGRRPGSPRLPGLVTRVSAPGRGAPAVARRPTARPDRGARRRAKNKRVVLP